MSETKHLPPEALNDWLAAAAAELGLDPSAVDIATVLNVARDVAHDVARPAAPLSTFLLGVAVGAAGGSAVDSAAGAAAGTAAGDGRLAELAERLTSRAAAWKRAQAEPEA
ncbi:DUF6457 domain-containing protein [Leucobacter soli]|uniref:DUF6457 domain-containing protein n=1 Tax=Leucobacter soli TaxID=2812850 RepID=A0A916JSK1_9MICO|nr:DUF6457 domain-containing protein [Leucobacter soli]CAG7599600.1 hypothetical protein LEUCIP111803_00309 [Leucobacter soli]